mgnify:CR=1 FL=1
MHRIELNEEQRELLDQTLRSLISELGMEIAETERLRFRDMLKHRRAVMREIVNKLEHAEPAPKGA